jgi:hypothetical protein
MRDRVVDTTVRIDFQTNDADGAPVAPSGAFVAADFRIYKDGSATQKATTNGITVTSPFDSVVGDHLIEIDTSNDTDDAGFWALGSEYRVKINSAKTVDGQVQSGVKVGEFRLVSGAVELDPATQTQITAIETFATRITTGIVQDGAVWQFTANMLELGPSGGGGGDATLANQVEIKALLTGNPVIQVASPNVNGNLVLTQGDDYDGTANPRAQWTVTTDYTDGWSVTLTIRSEADAIVYTTSGTVVSATVIAVTIAAPTGLTMTGCPGQWQGKFDVQLTHTATGKKKTIALGVCYINEDQTR